MCIRDSFKAESDSFEAKCPGALSEAEPFATLHRLQQAEQCILTGEEGRPLVAIPREAGWPALGAPRR
eukprot:2928471-Pyramimonas_sp.AAC.1